MPSRSKRAPIGAGLVVLSSLFYASYGVWTKLIGDYFGSFTASALRCILVFAILVGIAAARKELQEVHWRRDLKWLLLMLGSSVLVSGPLYYAVLRAGLGISLALAYIGIVLGMFLFGWIFMGERLTKDKIVSIALGIVGLALVFSPSVKTLGWLALTAAFIAGLATAANMVTTKKIPYNGSQAAVLVWGTGVVANIPMAFLLHEHLPTFAQDIQWLYLVFFALASVVASWTFIRGLKLIEAGTAGVLGLLEIVFGVLFGIVFFGERPGLIVFIGMLAIVLAATVPYIKEYKSTQDILKLEES